ncbi:hypothetical protein DYB32_001565 [Aphanomyces invadans]|uniref:BZIP domain-containing protein n=1 Tax=Aphanomyces invadans TaxID=157072 RepID=A0A3R6W2T1_9STRA|nr:hypothetical protein DYB32_001565 [Aphanomyces invadans]
MIPAALTSCVVVCLLQLIKTDPLVAWFPFPKKSLFAPPNATRLDLLNKFVAKLSSTTLSPEGQKLLDTLVDVPNYVKDPVKAAPQPEAPAATKHEQTEPSPTEIATDHEPKATIVEIPVVETPMEKAQNLETVADEAPVEAPVVEPETKVAAKEPLVVEMPVVEPTIVEMTKAAVVDAKAAIVDEIVLEERVHAPVAAKKKPAIESDVVNAPVEKEVVEVPAPATSEAVHIPAVEEVVVEQCEVVDTPVTAEVALEVEAIAASAIDETTVADIPVADHAHPVEIVDDVVQVEEVKAVLATDAVQAAVEPDTSMDKAAPKDESPASAAPVVTGNIAVVPVNVYPIGASPPLATVVREAAALVQDSVKQRPNLLSIDSDDVYTSSNEGVPRSVNDSSSSVEFSTTDDEKYSTSTLTEDQRKKRNKKRAIKRRNRKAAAHAKQAESVGATLSQ